MGPHADRGSDGAGGGRRERLGAATARRLAAAAADVTIADLNADAGEALAGELGARFVACDVTREDDVAAAVPEGVRISVCCAGIGWAEKSAGSRGAHALEPFEKVVAVNLVGTFNVLRLAAAAMLANEPEPGRVRRARRPHRREPDAQRRGRPARRRAADAAPLRAWAVFWGAMALENRPRANVQGAATAAAASTIP